MVLISFEFSSLIENEFLKYNVELTIIIATLLILEYQ